MTLLEIGAYDARWRDVHLGPEQAVRAHELLRGELLMPIHWGTFDLAFHSWVEPVERLVLAASESEVRIAIPRPGQAVTPESPPSVRRWWPQTVPWIGRDLAPVIASHLPAEVAPRPTPTSD